MKYEVKEMLAQQKLEDRLTKRGWSGSNATLKSLMQSYNRKYGTQFKNAQDVLNLFAKQK